MVYQSSSRSLLTFGRTIMSRPYFIRNCLQNLPVELICMILENLEMPDLLRCILVSRYLRRAVNESSKLKYAIELAKHCMISVFPSSANPSFSTRLRFLRSREDAWKYLDFKERRPLNLPPTGSVYEFVGGLYGNGREDETRATASISFLELPSLDARLLGDAQDVLKIWTHPMDDVTIIDFTMDPAQDLLVLVGLAPPDSKNIYELHLRSIKTNQPHPKAPVTILHCLASTAVQPLPSDIVAAVRVQVFGDLVALLIKEVFESTGAHLEIWNWESGSSYSSAMFQLDGIDDFTFLTRNSFLVVLPAGRFEVYDFADPVNKSTVPTHRLSYAFPPLSEGYVYWYISMSSNPAPGYVPRCPTGPGDSPNTVHGSCRQLYYPRPDERIHACCLYILNPANEENAIVHSFVFFVNLKTLMNPPPEWLQHHYVRRKTTRSTRLSINADTQNLVSVSSSSTDINHGTTHHTYSNNSSNHSYPLFPTFDSAPHPQHFGMNDHHPSPPFAPTNTLPPNSSCNSESPSRSSNRSDSDIIVPWNLWGPQSTRWFEECLSTDWQHAVYGTRAVESVRPENHPEYVKSPAIVLNALGVQAGPSNSNQDLATHAGPSQQTHGQPLQNDAGDDNDVDNQDGRSSSPQRFLRLRNFNPFIFKDRDLMQNNLSSSESSDESSDREFSHAAENRGRSRSRWKQKGTDKPRVARWNKPRLVTQPSTTPVKGVFSHDIMSWLPYTEVISKNTYEVTDVMMDDSRLLLLKRGRAGRLKHVEVLMT